MIYQEMGQTTNAQIEVRTSYNGGLYLTTALDLKGRGIKQSGDGSTHKRGLKTYHATQKAMEKLELQYTTCFMASL
ncbi:hypothetical protein C7967_11524 [Thalassospira sp. 11-3]|nr:hypothetical protein C7967_11524 [Thalassospira sp. 11-3]